MCVQVIITLLPKPNPTKRNYTKSARDASPPDKSQNSQQYSGKFKPCCEIFKVYICCVKNNSEFLVRISPFKLRLKYTLATQIK